MHSEILLYVIIGNAGEDTSVISENPESGVFILKNFVTLKNQVCLVFGTGEIHGKLNGQTPSKYALGFLTKSGIPEITEACDLKRSGGIIQRRQYQISLNNTNMLKEYIDLHGMYLYGRHVYVIEYSCGQELHENNNLLINPLSVGIISGLQWGDSDLNLSVLPSLEVERRANVMIEGFPVTLGQLDHAVNVLDNEASELFKTFEITEVIEHRATKTEPPLYEYICDRKLTYEEMSGNKHLLQTIQSLQISHTDCYCVADEHGEAIKIYGFDTSGDTFSVILYEKFGENSTPCSIQCYVSDADFISDKWPNQTNEPSGNTDFDKSYFINKYNEVQEISVSGGMVDRDISAFVDTRNLKHYRTIKFNGLEWFAENLNFETENSWYYGNRSDEGDTHGRLYVYESALEALPAGWRLPTQNELTAMIDYLGGFNNASTKMMARPPTWDGTDDIGFSSLPSGMAYVSQTPIGFQGLNESSYTMCIGNNNTPVALGIPIHSSGFVHIIFGEIGNFRAVSVRPVRNLTERTSVKRRGFNQSDWILDNINTINSYNYVMSNKMSLVGSNSRLAWWGIKGDLNGEIVDDGLFKTGRQDFELSYSQNQKPPSDGGDIINGDIEYFEWITVRVAGNGVVGGNTFKSIFAAEFDIDIGKYDFDTAHPSSKLYVSERLRYNPTNATSSINKLILRLSKGQKKDIVSMIPIVGSGGFTRYPTGIVNSFKLADNLFIFPDSDAGSRVQRAYNTFFSRGKVYEYFSNPTAMLDEVFLIGHSAKSFDIIENDFEAKILLFVEAETRRSSLGSSSNPFIDESVFNLKIYEVGVVFKKSLDTRNHILMKSNGRLLAMSNEDIDNSIYIDNPIYAIKHFRALSNFEVTNMGNLDRNKIWGESYPSGNYSYRIDNESFNNNSTNELKNIKIAGQVLDYENAYTDKLVNELCRDFYLVSTLNIPASRQMRVNPYNPHNDTNLYEWIDSVSIANEAIVNIDDPVDRDSVPTINMSNILSFGNVIEPNSNDICLEPVIKYGYVEGIGFTKELSIHGIATHSVYQDRLGLAVGFQESDGEEKWKKCNKLFDKYRNFVPMPQNIIEQKWIQSYETAIWKLRKFLEWQVRSRIQIVVPWNVGRKWRVGTHIRLSLPHVMVGDSLLCVCESVGKNNQYGKVTVGLIYLESVNPEPATYVIIDESGDRDIVIDESGNRQIINIEGVV